MKILGFLGSPKVKGHLPTCLQKHLKGQKAEGRKLNGMI